MLPSGKLLHNYGKIHHFFMGKSTISMAIGPFSMSQTVGLPEDKNTPDHQWPFQDPRLEVPYIRPIL